MGYSNPWGVFLYKTYGPMNYAAALAQCESDGAFLAYPRSESENDFILSLIPSTDIWIGINYVDEEGTVVASDGRDIVFTKWYNLFLTSESDQDAAMMYGASTWSEYKRGHWTYRHMMSAYEFVCSYEIS